MKRVKPAVTWLHYVSKSVIKITLQSAIILLLIILAIMPMVFWLTNPIPTHIQVELIVDHVRFRVSTPTEFKPIKFHTATFRDFERFTFAPMVITNPTNSKLNTVNIKSKSEQFLPTLVMDTIEPNETSFGVLSRLTVPQNVKVVLDVDTSEKTLQTLNITLEREEELETPQPMIARFKHTNEFRLTALYCQIEGMDLPSSFQVSRLSPRDPTLKLVGHPNILRLMLLVSTVDDFEIVSSDISITDLDLFWEDQNKKRMKTAIKQGQIAYPAYPDIQPVTFSSSDLVFGKNDDFRIDKITFDAETKSIKILLSGLAKESIKINPKGFPEIAREYRLTRSDTISKGDKSRQVLLEILLWIIPTIIGIVGIVTINVVQVTPDEDD